MGRFVTIFRGVMVLGFSISLAVAIRAQGGGMNCPRGCKEVEAMTSRSSSPVGGAYRRAYTGYYGTAPQAEHVRSPTAINGLLPTTKPGQTDFHIVYGMWGGSQCNEVHHTDAHETGIPNHPGHRHIKKPKADCIPGGS